ncbi:MAG TPA: AMP-binding protein [Ktedonobacteraceae bacterium]
METLSLDQSNPDTLAQFAVCLQHEGWTRQQLQDFQARALRACREHAYAHSPFYQRFHQGLQDRPLQELPVLTKALMMEQFDELVTDRAIHLDEVREYLARADASQLFRERYQVAATSGSTGEPGIYLYDQTEATIRGNSFIRSSSWGGASPADRVASVTSVGPLVIGGRRATGLHLKAASPLEEIVASLNEYQPEVLLGYASIVAVLAEEQRAGRLHITPRVVFCAADTLTGAMRQRIGQAWQVPIYNSYGTTEGGVLAAECSAHQGLHLFEDFSIVEVVDEHDRPVPAGEQGARVLLTVLFRRTQPLIRCELSDLVRPSVHQQCACGRPFALLENIEGRAIEVLYFPAVSGKQERVSPYVLHTLFDPLPLSGWQIMQEPDGLHIFLTGASPEFSDDGLRDLVRGALIKRGLLVPAIKIQRVAALYKNASGKTPLVLPHLPPETSR